MRTIRLLFLSILLNSSFFAMQVSAQPGANDPSFNYGVGANDVTRACVIQNDGKIIVGGQFVNYNGTGISGIVRLNSDGSLDPSFNPGTGANNAVHTISIQSDGKIIIAGDFTSYWITYGIPVI